MRLEVSQGHQTWCHSICYVQFPIYLFMMKSYTEYTKYTEYMQKKKEKKMTIVCYSNFVRKMHRFWDNQLQKCYDLENWVRGLWRSLRMSLFDIEPMTSYWCSIVTMALSSAISETVIVKKYCNLEIQVKGQTRSLKVVPLDRLGMVSY